MPTKFERLQSLRAELFQLGRADLDFGIYRIVNLRRERTPSCGAAWHSELR